MIDIDTLVKDYVAGMEMKDLMAKNRCSESNIRYHLSKYEGDLPSPKERRYYRLPASIKKRIVRLYTKDRRTLNEVYKISGVPPDTIKRVLEEAGIPLKPRGYHNRRFHDQEEVEIAATYLNGATLDEIAAWKRTNKGRIETALRRQGVSTRTTWESRKLRGTEKPQRVRISWPPQ